ncbi:MAG: hypothetical protein ABFR75_02235 [Acidobacteriota bacterium]
MLKKIIIADIDSSVSGSLKTFCNPSKVEVNLYSGGEEILPMLGLEDPVLVFLSLDLPDVNDFVAFDILKRCSGSPSPGMYILYSEESEILLNSVMKLKFKADGYLKKPVDKSDLSEIIKKNLSSDCYLIPSDLTMKDILGDDDILDLGEVEEVKEPEMESDDIFVENIPVVEEHNDPGTREDIKKNTERSLDEVPDLNEPGLPEDSPFEINGGNSEEPLFKIEEDFAEEEDTIFQVDEKPEMKLELEKTVNEFKEKEDGSGEEKDTIFLVDEKPDMKEELDKLESELKEKEEEFNKEKKKLLRELETSELKLEKNDKEKEVFSEEKKKLLRELETSELKLEEKDKEKEEFKNKLETMSEDYEKKMEEMDTKYKSKLRKFENLLKKSLDEINED